jgi:Zn-dependent peptidase ImmA (M78 family)
VVALILNKQTEEAIELLAKHYNVSVPKLKFVLPKGHQRTAYGTYNSQTQTICVLNSDIFSNPFVIIHEFYHPHPKQIRGPHNTAEQKKTQTNSP